MESRPQSIVNFERCYLGAFVLGLVNTALAWSATRAMFDASPQAAMLGGWFLTATTLIGFAITLALWYFIARKGSAVAKWIVVVSLFALLMGTYPAGLSGAIGIFNTVLQAVAVSFLFKPDTKGWFGEKRIEA
jgi:asparagine N-glycosylation enzyme membrane subunit Stt3